MKLTPKLVKPGVKVRLLKTSVGYHKSQIGNVFTVAEIHHAFDEVSFLEDGDIDSIKVLCDPEFYEWINHPDTYLFQTNITSKYKF